MVLWLYELLINCGNLVFRVFMRVIGWWCYLYKMGNFQGKDIKFNLRYVKFEVRCFIGSWKCRLGVQKRWGGVKVGGESDKYIGEDVGENDMFWERV